MADFKRILALWGTLVVALVTGTTIYLLAAYITLIVIGGVVLAALVSLPFLVQSWHLRHMPLKQHRLTLDAQAHAQALEVERLQLERERVAMERERHEQDLYLSQRRFDLEQHMLLTRVLPDTNGHYPYVITEQGYQHLPNPHLQQKQLAAAQPTKGETLASAAAENIIPARYDLRAIWEEFTPSREHVFLGKSVQGPVYVPLHMLWHIALTGPTGGGKTSILRALLMQLLSLKCHVTLCDIHYAPIKEDGQGKPIDWRPIEKRLAQPVIRDTQTIVEWMEWLAYSELQARIDRQFQGQKVGRPLFFTIEELPAILDELGAQLAQPLAKVLRQGRQFGICFVGASQDLLTSTLKMSSGPRECFRTGYYTGGDPTTAKALLDLRNGEKIQEDGLGVDGLVYLKTAMHQAQLTRVGWASNEALYTLLEVPLNERLGSENNVVDADTEEESRQNPNVWTPTNLTLVRPVERAEATTEERLERPKMSRLSDVEVSQFIAAYRAAGSIDKALSAIGRGTSYREHARELVRVHNLKKAEA